MLREADTTRLLRNRIRRAKLFGHVMRRKKLEQLVTTEIEGKRSRGKQREKLDDLTKWLKIERMTEALQGTRNTDAWKFMIVYAKEHTPD